MKKLRYLLPILLIISSCTRFSYITFDSDLPMNPSGLYTVDQDSLHMAYRFTNDADLELQITNTMDKLVFVDWEKSFLIVDDRSIRLKELNGSFQGTTDEVEIEGGIKLGSFSGAIYSEGTKTYIPPFSRLTHLVNDVPVELDVLKENQTPEKVKLAYANGQRYRVDPKEKKATYRTYIYLETEKGAEPIILEHSFRIIEVWESLDGSTKPGKNQLKYAQVTEAGAGLGVVGLFGLAFVLVAADQGSNP